MTKGPMNEGQWTGMPESTEEQIEEEVVSLILGIMERKKRNDRLGAKWKVGTTTDVEKRLMKLRNPQAETAFAISRWHRGSPKRAAIEISKYHGMEMEGIPDEEDTSIYVYTDRPPTKHERKQREKEPLTIKQKRIFRAIKEYVETNGRGPIKREVMRLAGHKSAATTYGFLDILEKKNWIIVDEGRKPIELILRIIPLSLTHLDLCLAFANNLSGIDRAGL